MLFNFKFKSFSFALLLLASYSFAQTGIGTATPHASAKLEVASTTMGFLPPRMTSAQRLAISNPAEGLMVYQTDGTSGLYYRGATDWIYIINSSTNILPVANGGTGTTTSTGTGSVVLSTSPTLVSPTFGNATGTSLALTGTTLSTSTSTGALTVAGGAGIGGALHANTLSLSNSTNGTSSLVLRNGDSAEGFANIPQIRMGWLGSSAGTSQFAQIIHTRHNSGPSNNAIDFYLSNGTADNTITSGSTRAMSITSPGNVEITGKLNVGDPTGNVVSKVGEFVNAGTFVILDNLKVAVTTSGNRGLSIGAVSTNFEADLSGVWMTSGGSAGASANNLSYTTASSTSLFNVNFISHGDTAQYQIRDKTNNRFYRVIMMIGASYISNFISIERLF
jgi:hypothetical protein